MTELWRAAMQHVSPFWQGVLLVLLVAVPLLLPFLLIGAGRRVSGRAVLVTFVSLFAVIIGINVYMAGQAVGTFPGLEVQNSYVASQTFDADRAAQRALGWRIDHGYDDGVMTFAVRDQAGNPVAVKSLTATIGRPTHVRDDVTPDFAYQGGLFTAPVPLAPGNWLIHLEVIAPDGTPFRQRFDFTVPG